MAHNSNVSYFSQFCGLTRQFFQCFFLLYPDGIYLALWASSIWKCSVIVTSNIAIDHLSLSSCRSKIFPMLDIFTKYCVSLTVFSFSPHSFSFALCLQCLQCLKFYILLCSTCYEVYLILLILSLVLINHFIFS